MKLPELTFATKLKPKGKRLFIGAYGFEDRTLGWPNYQYSQGNILNNALMFRYNPSKGHENNPNKVDGFQQALKNIGVHSRFNEIVYDWHIPQDIENEIEDYFDTKLKDVDEVIIDISAMTKFLILVCMCKLSPYQGTVRIIYTESVSYSPTLEEYNKSEDDMAFLAKFPSQGVVAIARARCLSSIRMQGQPITLIAFTTFNEQLIRHLLGTLNPHRLIFINGRPPSDNFAWREKAMQDIHERLIEYYQIDNPKKNNGLLINNTSTLNYIETVETINDIYNNLGSYERIMCGATGSKMQTVGLFFAKMLLPDIHIEYPIPDSYYVEELSTGIGKIYEIVIPNFSEFLENR